MPMSDPNARAAVAVVMRPGSPMLEVAGVLKRAEEGGLRPCLSPGDDGAIIGLVGDKSAIAAAGFSTLPGVERVVPVDSPFKLASRQVRATDTAVRIGGVQVGGGRFAVI